MKFLVMNICISQPAGIVDPPVYIHLDNDPQGATEIPNIREHIHHIDVQTRYLCNYIVQERCLF